MNAPRRTKRSALLGGAMALGLLGTSGCATTAQIILGGEGPAAYGGMRVLGSFLGGMLTKPHKASAASWAFTPFGLVDLPLTLALVCVASVSHAEIMPGAVSMKRLAWPGTGRKPRAVVPMCEASWGCRESR